MAKQDADTQAKSLVVGQSRVDSSVMTQIGRMEGAMSPYVGLWREVLAFFDNMQYVESVQGQAGLDTAVQKEVRGGRTGHKPRVTRNRYTDGILAECAWLSAQVPGYECTPWNGDPGVQHQARMAEKVLLSLWEDLGLDRVGIGRLIIAANCGGAYIWPYFRNDVGAYVGEDEYGSVQRGEIDFVRLQPDELMWTPGETFDQSRVHVIKKAYPVGSVMARPGYIGPPDLKPNAEVPKYEFGAAGSEQADLVIVYEWLERPSARHPKGRWLSFLDTGEVICQTHDYPREPRKDSGDCPPCVMEMVWTERDHRHRPMGVGERALDIQRTRNATISQILAWKNLILQPRLLAPYGSEVSKTGDGPGDTWYYRVISGMRPEWQPVQDIPATLFTLVDQCDADFDELFGKAEPASTESAEHLRTVIERENQRRGLVVKNYARFHAQLGEYLLELAQSHYTEERLLAYQGRFGVDLTRDFKVSSISQRMMVRVAPGSMEPRSRAGQEAKVTWLMDKGLIPPHQALAALQGGTAEKLIDEFELHIARAYRQVERIILVGHQPAGGIPSPEDEINRQVEQGIDPYEAAETAMDAFTATLGELMPTLEDYDSPEIHQDVFQQWMLTRDFEDQPDVVKGMARMYRDQCEQTIQMKQLQEQMAAQGVDPEAQEQGMLNAGRPPAENGQPSEPSIESQKKGLE